jgi:hypothetical protein
MQLLDMSPPAARCVARHWYRPLLGSAWLVLVMKEAERAEPVVLYQPLPLPSGQSPEHLAKPGRVHGRAPHHILKHTRLATISLAMPLPVDPPSRARPLRPPWSASQPPSSCRPKGRLFPHLQRPMPAARLRPRSGHPATSGPRSSRRPLQWPPSSRWAALLPTDANP